MGSRGDLVVGGVRVPRGERVSLELPVSRLYTHAELTMPVRVIRGRKDGPTLFVSAAIHGDEINGVEVIRRLLRLKALERLRGTLIAVPVVNVFGFIHHTRYLPDRRDLNRVFPGSERGSLAARLADLFMREVVARSTHGIDLHTGALHRTNIPHVRVNFANTEALRLANVFGAPVVLHSSLRDGSLREAVAQLGIPMLLFEAGEALRFDEWAIRAGLHGVVNVMIEIGMLPPRRGRSRIEVAPVSAESSRWIRAQQSGVLRSRVRLGAAVEQGMRLGTVADPLGAAEVDVVAPHRGVILGQSRLPLVYEGDALFHLAQLEGAMGDLSYEDIPDEGASILAGDPVDLP